MVDLERESMLRHPLMVVLAGVSTLSLTTAATADLTNDTIRFEFYGDGFGTFVTECDVEYDAVTGVFSDVTITDVAAETHFENPFWTGGPVTDLFQLTFLPEGFLSCTIQLDVEGYGPMKIDLELGVAYTEPFGWEGGLYGTYGPPMPFGAGESFTGDWNARVVPAPGALALLGVAGLAGRRRRD
jgi:MYXO-CTERM domain-containing protein